MTLQNIGNYLISPWFFLALYQAVLCGLFSFHIFLWSKKDWPNWTMLVSLLLWSMLMSQCILWVLL